MGAGIWEAIKGACAKAGIRTEDVFGVVTKYIVVLVVVIAATIGSAWYYDKDLLKSIINCYLNGCVVLTEDQSNNVINNFNYLIMEASKCRGTRSM